jgi:hypothetical protein
MTQIMGEVPVRDILAAEEGLPRNPGTGGDR